MDVAHTGQKLQAGAKRVLEVSLVRQGAREACFVTAFEEEGQRTHFRGSASAGAQPAACSAWPCLTCPETRTVFVSEAVYKNVCNSPHVSMPLDLRLDQANA